MIRHHLALVVLLYPSLYFWMLVDLPTMENCRSVLVYSLALCLHFLYFYPIVDEVQVQTTSQVYWSR